MTILTQGGQLGAELSPEDGKQCDQLIEKGSLPIAEDSFKRIHVLFLQHAQSDRVPRDVKPPTAYYDGRDRNFDSRVRVLLPQQGVTVTEPELLRLASRYPECAATDLWHVRAYAESSASGSRSYHVVRGSGVVDVYRATWGATRIPTSRATVASGQRDIGLDSPS